MPSSRPPPSLPSTHADLDPERHGIVDRTVSDRRSEADRHAEPAEAVVDRRAQLVGRTALRHGAEDDAAHVVEHARLAELGQHAIDAAQRALVGVLEEGDRTGEAGCSGVPASEATREAPAEQRSGGRAGDDRARDRDLPAALAGREREQMVERAGLALHQQVVRHHGAVQGRHARALDEELQQRGRVAEADAELGVPADPARIDLGQDPGDAVAAAGTPQRTYLRVGEGVQQLAPTLGVARREVVVAVGQAAAGSPSKPSSVSRAAPRSRRPGSTLPEGVTIATRSPGRNAAGLIRLAASMPLHPTARRFAPAWVDNTSPGASRGRLAAARRRTTGAARLKTGPCVVRRWARRERCRRPPGASSPAPNPVRMSQQQLFGLGRTIVDALVRADLATLGGTADAAAKAIAVEFETYENALAKLDADAERLADEHLRALRTGAAGIDRHRVVQMIRTKLAEERDLPV